MTWNPVDCYCALWAYWVRVWACLVLFEGKLAGCVPPRPSASKASRPCHGPLQTKALRTIHNREFHVRLDLSQLWTCASALRRSLLTMPASLRLSESILDPQWDLRAAGVPPSTLSRPALPSLTGLDHIRHRHQARGICARSTLAPTRSHTAIPLPYRVNKHAPRRCYPRPLHAPVVR